MCLITSNLSAPRDKRLQVQVRLQKGLKCCRAFCFNPFKVSVFLVVLMYCEKLKQKTAARWYVSGIRQISFFKKGKVY